MDSPKRPGRIHIFVATAWFVVYGASTLQAAYLGRTWKPLPLALVVMVAAVAVATRRYWARVLVYPIALLFVGTWLRQIWFAYSSGLFSRFPLSTTAISFAPGALLVVLAIFCCYVATVYLPWQPRRT